MAGSNAPLWASPFRPLHLLGAVYAPLALAGGAGAWLGRVPLPTTPALWHGHEMLFGFALAIVLGTALTALPSWAGTPEIRGRPLAALTALWLLGRAAFWAAPWLPAWAVALADLPLLPLLAALVTPALLRVPDRPYLLLPALLLALAGANLAYHVAVVGGDAALAERALRAGVYGVIAIFLLKGGVLVPIFTGNALRAAGRGEQPPFRMPLEAAALAAVLLLAALDLARAPRPLVGSAALLCALVHGVRSARWLGWRVAGQPLVASLNLAFAWLVAAFVLKAGTEFGLLAGDDAWLHAFTVGALGLMMLGLMNRVVLRHTGRALAVPAAMRLAYAAMLGAALLRLAASLHPGGPSLLALAGLLWALPFGVYLALYGRALLAPSLPRAQPLRAL